jgi:RNA polymerase sigma factor (sigma-70 family)
VDYVDHPSYKLIQTEAELFGPQAELVPVPRWRQYPELDEETDAPPKARTQLNRKQEELLFKRYNYARYKLRKLMLAQQRRFSARRVPEILTWYRHCLDGRAALTNANMALVVAMAKRTRINAVEFGELVSEGNMALLRAVDKFDISRGFKFSTYACRAILKAFNRLATKTGTYRQHFPTEFDPEMERSDEIERRHSNQRELAIEDLQRVLAMNLAELNEVERTVVSARFAVAGHRQVRTLEQVGRLVGLSKERVRQVQNEALTKLRAALDDQAA